MYRFITDNPGENIESANIKTLLNFAYEKDGKVMLRYADGQKDVYLSDYIARHAPDDCKPTIEDIEDGCCAECDDDCILSLLSIVATQAAELRGELKDIKDEAEKRKKEQGNCKCHTRSKACSTCKSLNCEFCNGDKSEYEKSNYCNNCGRKLGGRMFILDNEKGHEND